MVKAASRRPLLPALALASLAGALFVHAVAAKLPMAQWWQALVAPESGDLRQLLVHHSMLPRLAMSLLCGAALGLAGALFQQVLRNPLAEPGTLAIFAGAKLALAVTMLWAPTWLALGSDTIAFVGGGAAMVLALSIAMRRNLSPLTLVLSGLIVTIYLGALNAIIALFHHDALIDLFIWQAGSLNQNNWSDARALAPRLLAAAVVVALMVRPLRLLDLEDEGARAMGLSLMATRLGATAIAVLLTAFVVGAVGVISFIGLAGPLLARLGGARRLEARLVWSAVLGATLLAATDQIVQWGASGREIPTGAVTALLGAPLLLWMLPRLRAAEDPRTRTVLAPMRLSRPWLVLLAGLPVTVLAVWVALSLGRVADGWHWSGWTEWPLYLPWRGMRVAAALAGGALFGLAGTMLQRLTGNAMASPESLGISSGAMFGLIVAIFLVPNFDRATILVAATAGAFATLVAMLSLGRKAAYSPDHMLLGGIALGTMLASLTTVLLASGDPRTALLLNAMAGSTYGATAQDAAIAALAVCTMLILAPIMARWLAILPLGPSAAQALGVELDRARLVILVATALLTGVGTLITGPLSFVGLMAPHIVRLLGFQRPTLQLYASALLGGLIMVCADWAGRNIAFPWQVPAGLVAAFIGGSYFLWLMRRG